MLFQTNDAGLLVPAELPKPEPEPAVEPALPAAYVTDPKARAKVEGLMMALWHHAGLIKCTGGFINRDPNSEAALLLKKFDDLGRALLGDGAQWRGEEYC